MTVILQQAKVSVKVTKINVNCNKAFSLRLSSTSPVPPEVLRRVMQLMSWIAEVQADQTESVDQRESWW